MIGKQKKQAYLHITKRTLIWEKNAVSGPTSTVEQREKKGKTKKRNIL